MDNYRKMAEEIFLAGVAAVLPDKLIREHVRVADSVLTIGNDSFDLRSIKNAYVIGAGKASASMAKEIEAILGNRITEGHIIIKYDHGCELKHVQLTEAGHPTPDANGVKGTAEILRIAKKATADDLVLCLLSGGGSSLIADFPDGAQLEDLIQINRLLVSCGADITEINTVRKHLSQIKGGQLAKAVHPAQMVSLILSDVIGDPLDVIASGPSVPDQSTFQDAMNVVKKYDLTSKMPPALFKYLADGVEGRISETPKRSDPIFEKTHTVVIGNNTMALQAASQKATELGFDAKIVNTALSGDSALVAKAIMNDAVTMQSRSPLAKNICLLFGGETTLKVAGSGLGGRNQHLALAAAIELENKPGITLLAAGTDGTDGPTDAAGAVVDSQTVPAARAKGIDARRYLKEFDSYHFFKKTSGHVITGPTLTNIMDLVVVLIEKPPQQQ